MTGIGGAGEGGQGREAGQPVVLEAGVGHTAGRAVEAGHHVEGQGHQNPGQGHLRKMKLGEMKLGENLETRKTDAGGWRNAVVGGLSFGEDMSVHIGVSSSRIAELTEVNKRPLELS